jgi:hypothetical protein
MISQFHKMAEFNERYYCHYQVDDNTYCTNDNYLDSFYPKNTPVFCNKFSLCYDHLCDNHKCYVTDIYQKIDLLDKHRSCILTQLKTLTCQNMSSNSSSVKVPLVVEIFNLLIENKWFMRINNRFPKIVFDKLSDLEDEVKRSSSSYYYLVDIDKWKQELFPEYSDQPKYKRQRME